jgi:crotonobetainyl-CoA:carnitine CoA-transferase CaiB-like acyl-CoA transferase
LFTRFLGIDAPAAPMPTVELPSIEPTKDGYVGFCTIPRQQFQDFLVLIERPDLLADEGLANVHERTARMAEFLEIVHAWTTRHTTDEIIERASAMRIPVAPILDGATVVEHEHFVARGAFVENPAGFTQPRVPYRIGDLPRPDFRPAPALGEHDPRDLLVISAPREQKSPTETEQLPLERIRVIDFTAFWAGPSATQVLAGLGADVIKVESIQRPDGMRFTSTQPPSVDQWWEWGPVFHGANSGKRSVTLDLNHPDGLALAKRLIAEADAVVENFSPRVMENFGLGWEAVHATNPAAIMVRMPAFGLDGPWRDRTGFAQTMEQMTGMAAVTGFADGPPLIPRGPCDPLAGLHAVLAFLAALEERARTGAGMLVEVTMAEAALNAAAEPVVEYSATGTLIGRRGNNSDVPGDPQDVFPCAGGQWVALAAPTATQQQALAALAGDDVRGWCATRAASDAAEELIAAGVPAAVVIHAAAVDENEQLRARGFYEILDHPVTGRQLLPSIPLRFARRGFRWHRTPPPTLGQHNEEVLGGLLGLDADALQRLEEARVIGQRPIGL